MNLFWKERKKKEMEKVRSKEREREREGEREKKKLQKEENRETCNFFTHKEKQAEKVTKCQKIKNKKAKSIFLYDLCNRNVGL